MVLGRMLFAMRACIQRVSQAKVVVENETSGEIGRGLLVLLGVAPEDTQEDLTWLAEKIIKLRIFADEEGKMNLSLADIAGEMLVVSQFTLYGDCRKGRRPSFINAAPPRDGESNVRRVCCLCDEAGNRNRDWNLCSRHES